MTQPPGIFTIRWWRIVWMVVRDGLAYRFGSGRAHPETKAKPAEGDVDAESKRRHAPT